MNVKRSTDPEVKKIGEHLLNHVNFVLDIAAGNNAELRFKLNRWVYARLQLTERRMKDPIKKQLFDAGIKACQAPGCGKTFASLKNVEIHRKNNERAYSIKNCMLVCRQCHEKYSA